MVAKSLNPTKTVLFTHTGQPDPLIPLVSTVVIHLWSNLHFQLTFLFDPAVRVVGSQPSACDANSGLVVAKSLNPTKTVLLLHTGQP